MPCRATQDRQVMVKSPDKTWSAGEGNANPLQYSCPENPMNSMKQLQSMGSQRVGHNLATEQQSEYETQFLKINLFKLEDNYSTVLWWFLPYMDMNQPRVYMCPPSEPPFHLPPHPIPLDCPRAPALSALSHASNLDWSSVSHMVTYMFHCCSLRSSHPHLLPQSQKLKKYFL